MKGGESLISREDGGPGPRALPDLPKGMLKTRDERSLGVLCVVGLVMVLVQQTSVVSESSRAPTVENARDAIARRDALHPNLMPHPRADCIGEFFVPPRASLSGEGRIWEYYHMLIEWAPRVLARLRSSACSANVVFHPDWSKQQKFRLTYNGSHLSMQRQADDIFRPFKLRLKTYSTTEEIRHLQARRGAGEGQVSPLPFCSSRSWTDQDAQLHQEWLEYLRAFVLARSFEEDLAVPRVGDVVIIRRGRPKAGSPAFGTGAERRALPPEFFRDATAFMSRENISHSILELEGLSVLVQARMFAQARVVVGIHGAGLSNVLWMGRGGALLEFGQAFVLSLQRLSLRLGHKYRHHPYVKWNRAAEAMLLDVLRTDSSAMPPADGRTAVPTATPQPCAVTR